MKSICLLVGVAIFAVAQVHGQDVTQDYCSEEWCQPEKRPHIACRNNNAFVSSCPRDRQLVPMSTKRKNLLLMLHNRMRNKVALGKLEGYQQAKRMPILQWDDELAYLAELNVKTCKFAHDSCRNTKKYRTAGQNLAYGARSDKYKPLAQALKDMMRAFFNEYKDANMTYIKAHQNHDKGKQIGHFTQLVSDRTNRVGCAISRYTEWSPQYQMDMKTLLLACDYSFTNIWREPVYETGPTASGCKAGRHNVYEGLCKASEDVNPYQNFYTWWLPQNRG
uniref:Venom allergen-1 n=1 Tax=Simulium vittatum TaxID=7192 RepID=B5M0N0_SIMVI|nr:salivary secreted antigen-5 related protein [Simulium vittatum]